MMDDDCNGCNGCRCLMLTAIAVISGVISGNREPDCVENKWAWTLH